MRRQQVARALIPRPEKGRSCGRRTATARDVSPRCGLTTPPFGGYCSGTGRRGKRHAPLACRRLLLSFFREAGAAQSVGERAAALFLALRGGRARRWVTRRGTAVAIAGRGGVGTVAAGSDLVVQPQ